jgi:hypothetical protein
MEQRSTRRTWPRNAGWFLLAALLAGLTSVLVMVVGQVGLVAVNYRTLTRDVPPPPVVLFAGAWWEVLNVASVAVPAAIGGWAAARRSPWSFGYLAGSASGFAFAWLFYFTPARIPAAVLLLLVPGHAAAGLVGWLVGVVRHERDA